MDKATGNLRFILLIAMLLAAFAAKGLLIQPRQVPGSDFDTGRAVERLERILGDQRPHPVDTPANDAVRDRLRAELTAIGLESGVMESTDCSNFPKSRTVSCSHVRNVIATIPGDPSRKALLLNAHYDSTPTGPGAADDGIGVAVMLEVAANLARCPSPSGSSQSPPPLVSSEVETGLARQERPSTTLGTSGVCGNRTVILLFNEGEEYGLNGAAAFVDSGLAGRIDRLINIESRGVSGPAIMFETSTPNGPALADFAAASARPYANSLSADFAKLIPNSTDVVKFKPMGWRTLNFAITGNETRYHSPGDDLAHLDRRSVAHMGGEVLAATRRMAGPEQASSGGRSIYTDVAGLFLLKMPLLMGALLLGGLLIAGLALVHRRRAWKPLGWVALAFAASIAIAAILATAIGFIRPGDYWRAYPWLPTLAVAATVIAVQAWLVGRADRGQRRLAAWALVLLVGAGISLAMPGATIFFLIAPALGLLGLKWRPLAWAGALVQLVMLGELVALIELTLIDGPVWAVAPVIALISLPFLAEIGRSPRAPHMLLAVIAIALWISCLFIPRATADRPQAMTVDHVQDERRGEAHWAIAAKQAPLPPSFDRFGPWRSGPLPYNKRPRWLAQAPLIEGARGNLTLIQDRPGQGNRLIRLRFDRAGADSVLLRFDEKTPVLAMGLPDRLQSIDDKADKGPSILRCTGRRCDGLVVEVILGTTKPVLAMLVAARFAPPPEAPPLIAAMPRNSHPQYSPHGQVRVRAVRF